MSEPSDLVLRDILHRLSTMDTALREHVSANKDIASHLESIDGQFKRLNGRVESMEVRVRTVETQMAQDEVMAAARAETILTVGKAKGIGAIIVAALAIGSAAGGLVRWVEF